MLIDPATRRGPRRWCARTTRASSRRHGRPTARGALLGRRSATGRSTSSPSTSPAGAVRQVTDTVGGAQFPELSPDGDADLRRLHARRVRSVFAPRSSRSGRRRRRLRQLKLGRAAKPEQPTEARRDPARTPRARAPTVPGARSCPTFWTPIVETDGGEIVVGAATAMSDALGRHAYAVDAGWAARRARPDWHAAYAYDRWRPTLFASYSDDTDPDSRRRRCAAASSSPARCCRSATCAGPRRCSRGFDAQTDTLTCATIGRACRTRRAGAICARCAAAGCTTAAGSSATRSAPKKASRSRRRPRRAGRALGSDADAGAAMFDARAYQPRRSAATPSLAGRVAAAGELGRRSARGACSRPAAPGRRTRRSTSAATPSACCAASRRRTSIGTRAAVANLDLRFPLARLQRGAGSWPLFLHVAPRAPRSSTPATPGTRAFRVGRHPHVDRRRAVARPRRPPLRAADARRRRRVDARSRRAIAAARAFFGRIGYAF